MTEEQPLAAVTTEVLLRFLRGCREATVAGRPGPNVVRLSGRRAVSAPVEVNRSRRVISSSFLEFPASTEWGWPDAPPRNQYAATTINRRFAAIPKLPQLLPRYLPVDVDRRLTQALG